MDAYTGDKIVKQEPAKRFINYMTLPSLHQIGHYVNLRLPQQGITEHELQVIMAEVTGVHFYPGKVKYDLMIRLSVGDSTRIYNVDSCYVYSNVDGSHEEEGYDIPALMQAFPLMLSEKNALKLALENLHAAVPGQTNDADWWSDELRKVMEEAEELLYDGKERAN